MIMKRIGVDAHYIGYSEFKDYVMKAIQVESKVSLSTSSLSYSIEDTVPVSHRNSEEKKIAWTRIYTKFLQYIVLCISITYINPILFETLGL